MAVVFTGCDKTTGDGWFYNYGNEDQKVTFGFNAQPVGEPYLVPGTAIYGQNAKGEFQLVDHANKIKIHGTFTITLAYDPTLYEGYQVFGGAASVNGEEGFGVTGYFYDANHDSGYGLGPDDRFQIQAYKGSVSYDYFGVLTGGNVTTHK